MLRFDVRPDLAALSGAHPLPLGGADLITTARTMPLSPSGSTLVLGGVGVDTMTAAAVLSLRDLGRAGAPAIDPWITPRGEVREGKSELYQRLDALSRDVAFPGFSPWPGPRRLPTIGASWISPEECPALAEDIEAFAPLAALCDKARFPYLLERIALFSLWLLLGTDIFDAPLPVYDTKVRDVVRLVLQRADSGLSPEQAGAVLNEARREAKAQRQILLHGLSGSVFLGTNVLTSPRQAPLIDLALDPERCACGVLRQDRDLAYLRQLLHSPGCPDALFDVAMVAPRPVPHVHAATAGLHLAPVVVVARTPTPLPITSGSDDRGGAPQYMITAWSEDVVDLDALRDALSAQGQPWRREGRCLLSAPRAEDGAWVGQAIRYRWPTSLVDVAAVIRHARRMAAGRA